MKISGAKKIHYDSGPNMTPLVDVVMVILIFLMLAGSFGTADHYLVSDVPVEARGAGGKPPESGPLPAEFTINVEQDGPFYIARAGNFSSVRSTDSAKAYTELKTQLHTQLVNFRNAGVKPDDVQVYIFPTGTVTLANLVQVFEAAQDAGFKKVGFGVRS